MSPALAEVVRTTVEAVPDPEYPGIGIGDLGIVDAVRVHDDGHVDVVLVPTFLGCPALDLIARDVSAAAAAVPQVRAVDVRWSRETAWSPVRISTRGRRELADEFAVAVSEPTGRVSCPVCGHAGLDAVSDFGPSLCRRIARCPECRNPVEVVRG